jgi:c-di-GMP-binding flagellar brake protein YcgR
MNNDLFRICDSRQELINILNWAQDSSLDMILWQKVHGPKASFTGRITNIDLESDLIVIFFKHSGPVALGLDLSERITFYHKANNRSFLFKTSIKKISGNFLMLKIPRELRLYEYRLQARYLFKPQEMPKIVFAFNMYENISTQTKEVIIHAHVADISATGIGIVVSKKDSMLLDDGMTLELSQIGEKHFHTLMKAEIIYKRQVAMNIDGFKRLQYRLGVKMRKPMLINSWLHDFKQISKQQLPFDGENPQMMTMKVCSLPLRRK